MASYSSIDLVGNLGHAPERVNTDKGSTGARFSLAVNREWTDAAGDKKKETDWFQVIAWGRLAETCLTYLSKGRQVFVTGRPQIQQWTDEHNAKRERVQVVARQVIFLDGREPDEVDVSEEEDT